MTLTKVLFLKATVKDLARTRRIKFFFRKNIKNRISVKSEREETGWKLVIGWKSCLYLSFEADKGVKVTVKNIIKQVLIKIVLIMHLLEQLNNIMTIQHDKL